MLGDVWRLTNWPGLIAGARSGAWTFMIQVRGAILRFSRISASRQKGPAAADAAAMAFPCTAAHPHAPRFPGARGTGRDRIPPVAETLPSVLACGFVLVR